MNKTLKCALAFGLSMMAPLYSLGAVSLDSCRNMALRNNKTIRLAEEGIRSAGYEKKAAFANYLPGIDFTEDTCIIRIRLNFWEKTPNCLQ